MEGLALSCDGNHLFGLMQHLLLQDGERHDGGQSRGRHCRLVQVDIESGAVSEFVYTLDSPENGLNEITAIGPDEFLLIERDSELGTTAMFKKIMKISLTGATVLSGQPSLPDDIRPVRKEVFIDFCRPSFRCPLC